MIFKLRNISVRVICSSIIIYSIPKREKKNKFDRTFFSVSSFSSSPSINCVWKKPKLLTVALIAQYQSPWHKIWLICLDMNYKKMKRLLKFIEITRLSRCYKICTLGFTSTHRTYWSLDTHFRNQLTTTNEDGFSNRSIYVVDEWSLVWFYRISPIIIYLNRTIATTNIVFQYTNISHAACGRYWCADRRSHASNSQWCYILFVTHYALGQECALAFQF